MLVLPGCVRDALVAHAREGAPEEVCGVLAGRREGGADGEGGDDGDSGSDGDDGEEGDADDEIRVEAVRRVPNVADAPRTTYRLDPETQLRVHDEVEAAGREVVGFYHSHPAGPPGPSATDETRATWTGYVYVIVSLGGGDRDDADGQGDAYGRNDGPSVGAWTWTGEGFESLSVRVVE